MSNNDNAVSVKIDTDIKNINSIGKKYINKNTLINIHIIISLKINYIYIN